jgi:murein tripeptide amidase MpaA
MAKSTKTSASVRIVARTAEKLRALDEFRGLDLHRRAARRELDGRYSVPGVLTDAEIRRVRAAGYVVRVVERMAAVAAARAAEVATTPAPDRFAAAPAAAGAGELTMLTVQGGYLTAAEVESAVRRLATAHPTLARVAPLPERTWEGRQCTALRLAAPGGTPPAQRPGVLVTGSMHAREWGGSDICITFVTRLLDAFTRNASLRYGNKTFTAADVRRILQGLELFVFPDVNPDGKVFSQTQQLMWRKNRNPNNSVRPATQGVDNNRNFDFLWSSGIGSSLNRSSEVFRGTGPFSEPETRNVRHCFDAFPNVRYYVDVHSHGQLILFSWGDDDNQSVNPAQNFRNPAHDGRRGVPGDQVYREFIPSADQSELRRLADGMNAALTAVRNNPYTVQQAVGLYPTTGGSDDYAYSRHILNPNQAKVYGFTVEFGDRFVPPYSEMRLIMNEVSAALTQLCRMVS